MEAARELAAKVERFVRDVVVSHEGVYEHDDHGPTDAQIAALKDKARAAGLLTPHVRPDGGHLTQRETAIVLRASGLSPLGPLALNTAAPDEGNMYLLGRIGTDQQKQRFLARMLDGRARSAFLMTEPAAEGGAGSDPSMLQTTAAPSGNGWVINGRKAFITGYAGAEIGIVMAKTDAGDGKMASTMFLIDLPNPAIEIDHVPHTIDSSMPGGHATLTIRDLHVGGGDVLGAPHEGFSYAQVRLSPARLSHCMRWLGACMRAHEIAVAYAVRRHAFGKPLIDHEGVGFMLADNMIDLKQSELMIDWCADVLDGGSLGTAESSMAKVAVSEALFRVADRCVQVMGGNGVTRDTIVEQVFREIRAFRIYDGPTEVHKWNLARKIKREAAPRLSQQAQTASE
jgi:acyl-CoA dehydrogenase